MYVINIDTNGVMCLTESHHQPAETVFFQTNGQLRALS